LPILEEIEHTEFQALSLNNIGTVHMAQGRLDMAREYFDRALELSRGVGNRAGEATTLNKLGNLAFFQGDRDRAESHFVDALAIERAIGDRVLEGISLSNVAAIHFLRGNVGDAVGIWFGALRLHDELGDRATAIETLSGLGVAYARGGAPDQGRGYLEQALAHCHALGNQEHAALVEKLLDELLPAAEEP
jgi:tetratricopeptide (TPR) repeat protein